MVEDIIENYNLIEKAKDCFISYNGYFDKTLKNGLTDIAINNLTEDFDYFPYQKKDEKVLIRKINRLGQKYKNVNRSTSKSNDYEITRYYDRRYNLASKLDNKSFMNSTYSEFKHNINNLIKKKDYGLAFQFLLSTEVGHRYILETNYFIIEDNQEKFKKKILKNLVKRNGTIEEFLEKKEFLKDKFF